MSSPDEIRDVQRTTWAGLSVGWEKWDSIIMDQLAPVTASMIEHLDISDRHQHLDIAAGTGEPGLSIARLSPKGRVVLTELITRFASLTPAGPVERTASPVIAGVRHAPLVFS